jgi:acetyl-CoA acetyltransferase
VSARFAIVGLGVTEQGRVPDMSSNDMRIEGMRLAMADAGVKPKDVGGYVYQPGVIDMGGARFGMDAGVVPKQVGMSPRFQWLVQSGGVSAIAGITAACAAIDQGTCDYVAVNYADNLLSAGALVGAGTASHPDTPQAYGMFSNGADHALAARRHMHEFGTTKEQLGAIAVTQREHANKRTDAYMHGRPMSLDDYMDARPMADPLGKHDYCLTADGGCAFIVTTAARAADHANPVFVEGVGFGHSTTEGVTKESYLKSGVGAAAKQALANAQCTIGDIDTAQIYDCFTITVLMALEAVGFCGLGEGGPFVADGNLGLDGAIPTNTAGGELSWSYMQGFTPVVEGLRQMRHESGPTQVVNAERCLVTGHGGTSMDMGSMEYADACLILGRH